MPSAGTASVRARLGSIGLSRLVLFLDFDGTVVPIGARPEAVRLGEVMTQALDRLGHRLPIAVVSGRPVNDLRRVMGLKHIHYVGLHGFSYAAPGKPPSWLAPRPPRRMVRKWKEALEAVAGKVRGAWVEDKGISVALHDRQVRTQDRRRLRRQAVSALHDWLREKQIRLLHGKRVMEALPFIDWDKGAAVKRLLQKPWARSRVPVYFGDDITDLPALEHVAQSGLAIQVGSIPHAPKRCLRLANSDAVEKVLCDMAKGLNGPVFTDR
jgi:trehalose-phosphatase